MPATALRTITIAFSGDVNGTEVYQAVANANDPAGTMPIALAQGDNTITVPTGGTVTKAVSIVKPAGNVVVLKLKSVGGDSGFILDPLDPDSISIGPGQATFVINASAPVNVRLVWS